MYSNIKNMKLSTIQQNKNRKLNNTKIQGIGLCTVEDPQAPGSLLEVSFFCGCLGWAALFNCGTP